MNNTKLVKVGSFLNRIEAEMAQGALEAADIDSTVSADDIGGIRPSLVMGMRLFVRSEDAERAEKILGSSK